MPASKRKQAKARVTRVLYRHPRLHRQARRGWLAAQYWASRPRLQLFRLLGQVPEAPLALDPADPDLRAAPASTDAPDWEPAWHDLSDDGELRDLARAAVESHARSSPAFGRLADRLERGEHPYGLSGPSELEQEVERVRAHARRPGSGIEVWIGRTGKLGVRRGLLELALARERGERPVRARVARRHPAWQRLRTELAFEERRRGHLYQKVLHPDLEVFRAAQTNTDRMRIVEPHLPKGLDTALDLGASLGQFSRYLEDHGFRVTAAEEAPFNVHFLRLIRDTMGYSFDIFPEDVRRFEPRQAVDVLWAMSVLHFFTKTEEDHASLRTLLERLRPKMVFFQPPRGDEYHGLGWYRLYPPDEFAARVRDWCHLRTIDPLGAADNGRPIYRIR
jgi:hypothetical protein